MASWLGPNPEPFPGCSASMQLSTSCHKHPNHSFSSSCCCCAGLWCYESPATGLLEEDVSCSGTISRFCPSSDPKGMSSGSREKVIPMWFMEWGTVWDTSLEYWSAKHRPEICSGSEGTSRIKNASQLIEGGRFVDTLTFCFSSSARFDDSYIMSWNALFRHSV